MRGGGGGGIATRGVGLNKLFFFSSLLFYSFMLVLSTYNSFDYTYYSSIILIKKRCSTGGLVLMIRFLASTEGFGARIRCKRLSASGSALLDSLTTLESLALEVSDIDREELLDAIFVTLLLPQVRMR